MRDVRTLGTLEFFHWAATRKYLMVALETNQRVASLGLRVDSVTSTVHGKSFACGGACVVDPEV
jgi:hypothetical protein